MSIATDIADAVAAELNGGTFSQPVAAESLVLPEFELADLAELKVTVPVSLWINVSRSAKKSGT